MVMLNGWDIDLQLLSGFTEDAELVEVPGSNIAYIIYNYGEIGVSTEAGLLAVYRDKMDPMLIFHPQYWRVVSDSYTVRCNTTETILFVYIANMRNYMEMYGLMDLVNSKFAHVFVPNALYRYSFRQFNNTHFVIEPPGQGDHPPYERSYIVDSSSLEWFDYHKQGEFDGNVPGSV